MTSSPLWGGRFSKALDQRALRYTTSLPVDRHLFRYDVLGSMAHAAMLGRQGIIPSDHARRLVEGLADLLANPPSLGDDTGFEDVHSRGNTEAHRLQDPSKWVPFGVGAIEGSVSRPLRVLEGGESHLDDIERAATDTNAGIVEPGDLESEEHRSAPHLASGYAPGEEPRPRDGEPTGSAHGELL